MSCNSVASKAVSLGFVFFPVEFVSPQTRHSISHLRVFFLLSQGFAAHFPTEWGFQILLQYTLFALQSSCHLHMKLAWAVLRDGRIGTHSMCYDSESIP